MIPVNLPYKPPFGAYQKYLESVYERNWFTNNGPLVKELTVRLEEYLQVKNLLLMANGTLALQLAYRALGVTKQAVTTPFTFIATSSSLQWEHIQPRFADVDKRSMNLSVSASAELLSEQCKAIVPVHVYGNPADVEGFETLSKQSGCKVIYDAAHAFGINLKGQSILNYGDASILSFHATKVFHTVEGGAVVFRDRAAFELAEQMTNFGINSKTLEINAPGINCKLSEVHAAMGLAVLDNIDVIIEKRLENYWRYQQLLQEDLQTPQWHSDATYNGSYCPMLFGSAEQASRVLAGLASQGIMARRYFSPSLNLVSRYQTSNVDQCPIAEDFATRTLCLPLYYDLSIEDVNTVCKAVRALL